MATFPPMNRNDIAEAIARIVALDRRNATPVEVHAALASAFHGFIVAAPTWDPGLKVFRARKCADPMSVADLGYPPADRSGLQRASLPGKPVFYCSTSREVALWEVHPRPGEIIAVGEWATSAPLLVNHVGYSASVFQRLGSVRESVAWNDMPVPVAHDPSVREFGDYLSDLFSEPVSLDDEYKFIVTAAIAEKLLGEPFGGLMYPSVRMQANGDNIAIAARFADANLALQMCHKIHVDQVDEASMDFHVIDTAEVVGNSLVWTGVPHAWV